MKKVIIYRGRQRKNALRAREPLAASSLLIAALSIPGALPDTPLKAASVHRSDLIPAAVQRVVTPRVPPTPPPAFAPAQMPAIDPVEAASLNARIPFANGPNPAAKPFLLKTAPVDELRSLDCLTSAVYYEAASESEAGQRAVAQVVLNRMRHPAYPNSICGVVYQGPMRPGGGCQFTFTCDGSLLRVPSPVGWSRARRIAADALAGKVFRPVGLATHYHADYVLPFWATSFDKVTAIGAHIFYRWGGRWGAPSAFRQNHAGREPVPVPAKMPESPPLPAPKLVLDTAILSLPRVGATVAAPSRADHLPKPVETDSGLPESRVREAYRTSGAWREGALAAGAGAAIDSGS